MLFRTFSERGGSTEPYGIDEAHDLLEAARKILDAEAVMLRGGIALGAITALVVGCTADKPAPTGFVVSAPLFVVGGNSGGNRDVNLGTHLTGAEEVPPTNSKGQGQAIFRVNGDGSAVDFRLIASNIDNVTQSHIHCGRPGQNGPVRMWLYPVIGPTGTALTPAAAAGPQNGVLASGTFDPRPVICPAANVGQDMPLLDAIRAGLTYVNVHTNDGVAPANTGPGDFPGGEIRGQLDDHNH
ncbi:MAG TPA: CHRD domain-containing protein [Gemmatimonadaceae bacterium]|nr:CHRD domain-containing protein [Gemmatimonadaceae bacterium]